MRRFLVALALTASLVLPASAGEYFEGKSLSYIIATNPGGNYDAYARLIGKYLGPQLGVSKILYKNVPGAGHIVGANTLAASKPDGLTIGTFNTGLIYAQILQREGIAFDLTELSWIGKAAADARTMILGTNSGLKSIQDLVASEEQVNFAASGVGSASYTETKLLAEALDLNIKMIPGFRGNAGEMAMLRGEVVGQVASYASLKPFVDAGNGFVAVAIGGDLEPQAIEFAIDAKGRSIVKLIEAMSTLGRLTAAPPGVDPEVLDELRTAYMAVMNNTDFLADTKKLGLPIEPAAGADVAKLVLAALQQSPETVAIIAEAVDVEIPTVKATSKILSLKKKNKWIEFHSGDKVVKAKISGSRTKISLNGSDADRKALAVGMSCVIVFDPQHENNEPKSMDCEG